MTVAAAPAGALAGFVLPPELEADTPPERRGLRRDGVRLAVSRGTAVRHRRFRDLPAELRPGDLLVVNVSATLPASVVVDESLAVHFSTRQPDGRYLVEPRRPAGPASLPHADPQAGVVALPGGARLDLLEPYRPSGRPRLWLAEFTANRPLPAYLLAWGRPIRYRHVAEAFGLDAYQTVFARYPGSAEMPSAGRPFSSGLVTRLVAAGIGLAPITLHTGVSSQEAGEPPFPEWYSVPAATAARIDDTRRRSGRVIAVGTTVVRALETVAEPGAGARPGRGWTDLVVAPDHRLAVVDGLITGWHEPASTHLDMLTAIAGSEALAEAYDQALGAGYLWHEFGDSHLILR